MSKIPAEWIEWGADEHPTLSAADFDWTEVESLPIIDIGGKRFIEELAGYFDSEIDLHLEGLGLERNVSIEELKALGERRLAGWLELDRDLSSGREIKEPVQVAKALAWDSVYPRWMLCDGWHRLAAAIKHGHTTVPAIVGKLKERTSVVKV